MNIVQIRGSRMGLLASCAFSAVVSCEVPEQNTNVDGDLADTMSSASGDSKSSRNVQVSSPPVEASNRQIPDGVVADPAKPALACPAGSKIVAVTPNALYARCGSLYGETLYTPRSTAWKPKAVGIRVVSSSGTPVTGCNVVWTPQLDSGWVFPSAPETDVRGEINAWWTAGTASTQSLAAGIVLAGGGESHVTITGSALPHVTRADSVHINYDVGQKWDAFSVDVTPLKFPGTTYFSALNWIGAYTGVQNNAPGPSLEPGSAQDKTLLFSVWDSNGVNAELINAGDSICDTFGGEGTGVRCRLRGYKWKIGGTYRFEVTVKQQPTIRRTDYTVHVTDIGSGTTKNLGTVRYGALVWPNYGSGFVEDYASDSPSCLAAPQKTVYYHNVRVHPVGRDWTRIKSASLSRVFTPKNNEVCSNYDFAVEDGKFLMSTGGLRVGRPIIDGEPRRNLLIP